MRSIRNSSKLIMLTFVIISAFSCQSKKKAMQASKAAEEKARIEREASDKKIAEAEQAARKAEEEKARLEAEQRAKESETKTSPPAVKLSQYFNSIASSGSVTSANASINEALTMFASPETPVFIVISDSGGIKDYDKPTTIKDYLNYLKDQKKNINAVSSIKTDNNGKIIEVELRKN